CRSMTRRARRYGPCQRWRATGVVVPTECRHSGVSTTTPVCSPVWSRLASRLAWYMSPSAWCSAADRVAWRVAPRCTAPMLAVTCTTKGISTMYAVSLLSLLLGWLTAATVAVYALTLRRQLRQHRRDPLTGLPTRAAFTRAARRRIQRDHLTTTVAL